MTKRASINRPILPQEVAVIRAALDRAPTSPEYVALGAKVENLRVVGQCGCGCDSVDFSDSDPRNLPRPIADGIGETPSGGKVGVIIWGTADAVTGLEIYDLGAGDDDIRLPLPDSIHSWDTGAA